MARTLIEPVDKDLKVFLDRLVRMLNENFDHLDGQGQDLVSRAKALENRVLELEDLLNADTVPEHDHSAEDGGSGLDPGTSFTVPLALTSLGMLPMDGEDGIPEPAVVPGPPGASGLQGLQGPPGIDALDPEEPVWLPGPKGDTGPAGPPGAPGTGGGGGMVTYDDDGLPELPYIVPGAPGVVGQQGVQGPGSTGIVYEPEDPMEPLIIPGPPGAPGGAGAMGPAGLAIPTGMYEPEEPMEPMQIPGPKGADALPATQQRSIWVQPGDMVANVGVPTLAQQGAGTNDNIDQWLLHDGLLESVSCQVIIPEDWVPGTSLTAYAIFAGSVAGGNVRTRINYAYLSSGDDQLEANTSVASTDGMPLTAGLLTTASYALGPPSLARDILRLNFARVGADAADTFTGNLRLHSIAIIYTSRALVGSITQPLQQPYSPGSFTVPDGWHAIQGEELRLDGSAEATMLGDSTLVVV